MAGVGMPISSNHLRACNGGGGYEKDGERKAEQ